MTSALMELFPGEKSGTWSKAESTSLAQMIEAFGFGMEPDVRLGHANPSKTPTIAVFALPPKAKLVGATFAFATVLLRLGVAVAAAEDGISEEERQTLLRHVEKTLKLKRHEEQRARAYLHWLVTSTPGTAGLKSRLASLSAVHRHQIGESMILVAGADGFVSPAELKALKRGYSLLGLDPETLYGDVHEVAVRGLSGVAGGPVRIIDADTPSGHTVPPPAIKDGFSLDPERVAAIIAETEQVVSVLGEILKPEEE